MDKTFTQILEDLELSCNNSKEKKSQEEPSQTSLNIILQFARAYKVCRPEMADLPMLSMVMN
ncbi:MAG: hypothetical protein MJZ33_00840 [Paludibacteraceae bacterium]|nr:hypothetical protein [Paludibacteraceae bacterium]